MGMVIDRSPLAQGRETVYETLWYIGPDGLEYFAEMAVIADTPDCDICGDPIDYCMGGHAEERDEERCKTCGDTRDWCPDWNGEPRL